MSDLAEQVIYGIIGGFLAGMAVGTILVSLHAKDDWPSAQQFDQIATIMKIQNGTCPDTKH